MRRSIALIAGIATLALVAGEAQATKISFESNAGRVIEACAEAGGEFYHISGGFGCETTCTKKGGKCTVECKGGLDQESNSCTGTTPLKVNRATLRGILGTKAAVKDAGNPRPPQGATKPSLLLQPAINGNSPAPAGTPSVRGAAPAGGLR
jgi:hypothetical protein